MISRGTAGSLLLFFFTVKVGNPLGIRIAIAEFTLAAYLVLSAAMNIGCRGKGWQKNTLTPAES